MAKSEKKYVANVGINFEGLKPPVRVEAGDPIPSSVPESTIQDLLMDDAIKEVTKEEK